MSRRTTQETVTGDSKKKIHIKHMPDWKGEKSRGNGVPYGQQRGYNAKKEIEGTQKRWVKKNFEGGCKRFFVWGIERAEAELAV